MKKLLTILLAVTMLFALAACAGVEEQKSDTTEQTTSQEQAETPVPDTDWSLPDTIDMTEEVKTVFDKAMDGLTGVKYEPLGYLGEKDGVYCVLCRAAVVYPGAKPYYALVYVSEEGLQNIWDIWMGAHEQKE